jgi:hypothetical protein
MHEQLGKKALYCGEAYLQADFIQAHQPKCKAREKTRKTNQHDNS